jgi:hypothetical protein
LLHLCGYQTQSTAETLRPEIIHSALLLYGRENPVRDDDARPIRISPTFSASIPLLLDHFDEHFIKFLARCLSLRAAHNAFSTRMILGRGGSIGTNRAQTGGGQPMINPRTHPRSALKPIYRSNGAGIHMIRED